MPQWQQTQRCLSGTAAAIALLTVQAGTGRAGRAAGVHAAALGDEAVLYLPCFDSDPAFGLLKPRQQFRWENRPGRVLLLSDTDRCITAVEGTGGEGPLQVTACFPALAASQNWSSVVRGGASGRTGLAAPSGFTVCGGVPAPGGRVNGPLSPTEIPVKRNYRGWLTSSTRRNASSPGGTCLAYDSRAMVFRSTTLHGEQDLCLAVGPGIRPCDAPSPAANYSMCDTRLSLVERVDDLVRRIPAAARPHQLVSSAPAINSLWIPSQNYWNEALHGLLSGGAVSPEHEWETRKPTAFPAAISTAAALNRSLFWKIGSAIGTEARVESNAGTSRGWTFWSPNVNIFRDPRWGRGQETPGEDPHLNGEYGAMFVSGFQGDEHMPPPSSSATTGAFAYNP